jgi:protein-L-isoaspartate(D-aspartate) O-methyltransferase
LKSKGFLYTPIVEKTLSTVDRKLFCSYNPYSDEQKSIGFGATMTAPHIHSYILEKLRKYIKSDSVFLDIGSGNGYLTICMQMTLF